VLSAPSAPAYAIEVCYLNKWFGEHHVLRDISHTFEAGKLNMIIGASGSGKSVLLKNILGLLKPDSGQVFIGELDVTETDPKQLRSIRRSIGVLFQSSALFASQTVAENVGFPLKMFTKAKRGEINDRIAHCLEMVGLAGKEDLYPAELSGGMKKRAALARAIALQPTYLMCDEPNSGLDPKTAERIDELISDITSRLGTTTIVITHDMKSVLTFADTVMFIYQGEKAWAGQRADILEAHNPELQDFLQTSGLLGNYIPGRP